jgi:hypothetical protein
MPFSPSSLALTPESFLGGGHLLPARRTEWRSPYDILDSAPHSSMGSPRSFSPPPATTAGLISVENFDPKSQRRIFNEPLTMQALTNLKICQSDLYFPTAQDLARIAGDKTFYRQRLIERSLRLADAVREERARLLREATEEPADRRPIQRERSTQTQHGRRPFTSKARVELFQEKLTPAVQRAREIEEQLLRDRREDVFEREKRHERTLQRLELERQREQELQRELNMEKREKSQLFNEKVRQSQIQRIWEYEASVHGRRAGGQEAQPQPIAKSRLPKSFETFRTKSQIFAPITFSETG